jgi:hypothetical protein
MSYMLKTEAKERPILFSAPMVRAILGGKKTEIRRVMKPQPPEWATFLNKAKDFDLWQWSEPEQTPLRVLRRWPEDEAGSCYIPCPYGKSSERLWVRETWRVRGGQEYEYQRHQPSVVYRADADIVDQIQGEWRPSIFMRRWASRLTLEIVSARPERLKDIREEGCRAEGCYGGHDSIPKYPFSATPLEHYRSIWTKINGAKGPKSWDANPWVWVIEFRRHDS